MSQLIKHKLKFFYLIAFASLVASALFSGNALAAAAKCYTYDTTTYTPADCSLLMNNQAGFKPANTNPATCYGMRTSAQGVDISTVDCTAAASNGKNLSNIDFSTTPVNLGDPQGKYTCGGDGNTAIKTTINFGCVGKGNATLDLIFAIVRFLSEGAGIIVIGSLVFAGIQYTASRGDPSASAAAMKRIQNTLIALLIYIFAFAILNYVVPAGLLH